MKEPLIHSHITDILEDSHPKANETIFCKLCNSMLHAGYNECMQTWIESGEGDFCFECFIEYVKKNGRLDVLYDQFGLSFYPEKESE